MTWAGRHIGRITIETTSPMSCGSGEQGVVDALLARDANGLPMIPGATIQGLLRRLCDSPDAWFGCRQRNGSFTEGRLLVGSGLVHDSNNIAVQDFLRSEPDQLFDALRIDAPVKRDHVRLNDRHTAANAGKFDRAAVPSGTRFSFEIEMAGQGDEADAFEGLLRLVQHRLFRPGGSRARGYGRIDVKQISRAYFEMSKWCAYRQAREGAPSKALGPDLRLADYQDGIITATLELTPQNPWRVGSTGQPARTGMQERWPGKDVGPDTREQDVDQAPVREPRIVWQANGGAECGSWLAPANRADDTYVVPGSGVRGALAHRLMFHWNRLGGRMIDLDELDPEKRQLWLEWRERSADAAAILGSAKLSKTGDGLASLAIIEDARLCQPEVSAIDHVSIDRFTGGARPRLLFDEELLAPSANQLTVDVLLSASIQPESPAATALCHAIRDLTEGRLAIGAKSYGFAAGKVTWNNTDWQSAYNETQRKDVTA